MLKAQEKSSEEKLITYNKNIKIAVKILTFTLKHVIYLNSNPFKNPRSHDLVTKIIITKFLSFNYSHFLDDYTF